MFVYERLISLVKVKYLAILALCALLFALLGMDSHLTLRTYYRLPVLKDSSTHSLQAKRTHHPAVPGGLSHTLLHLDSNGTLRLFSPDFAGLESASITSSAKLRELSPLAEFNWTVHIYDWKAVDLNSQLHLFVFYKNLSIALLRADLTPVWLYTLPLLLNMTVIKEQSLLVSPFLCLRADREHCGAVFVGMEYIEGRFEDEPTKILRLITHPFTVFAFGLRDGHLYWTKPAGEEEQSANASASPASSAHTPPPAGAYDHWKLQLLREVEQHEHVQALDWEQYRDDIMDALPYRCGSSSQAVSMQLHHVRREPFTKESPSGRSPTAADKSYFNHNVLLVTRTIGLFIMDIASGKLRAKLAWDCKRGSSVSAWMETHQPHPVLIRVSSQLDKETHSVQCTVDVQALIGRNDSDRFHLNNLCQPPNYFDYPRIPDESWLEDPLKVVSPLVIPRVGQPSGVVGIIHYFLGHLQSSVKHFDYLFLLSDGVVSSVADNGLTNWRSNSQVSWIQLARHVQRERDELAESYAQFEPSLTAASFHSTRKGVLNVLIAIGWDSMAIIDPIHGGILAAHSLPCAPMQEPLVVGHVIHVPCQQSVIALRLVHSSNWQFYALLWTVVTGLFVLLSWICHPQNQYYVELTS